MIMKVKLTLRIWGTTFKPAMYKELNRLGVKIFDRIMVTSLLTEGGRQGSRCVGATGIHTRTGKFYIFRGKASIMCMSKARQGFDVFVRPYRFVRVSPNAMHWRWTCNGLDRRAEFTMMEKSVRTEFSAAEEVILHMAPAIIIIHGTVHQLSTLRVKKYLCRQDGNILNSVEERFYL